MYVQYVFFLLPQMEVEEGMNAIEVSDNLVVECQQGDTIAVRSANGDCVIATFDAARFLVSMLQSP